MQPVSICLGFAGALAGGILNGQSSAVNGLIIGYLLGEVIALKRRIARLEAKTTYADISQAKSDSIASISSFPPQSGAAEHEFDEVFSSNLSASEHSANKHDNSETNVSPTISAPGVTSAQEAVAPAGESSQTAQYGLERYLSGGNVMVRVGVIVLFFGLTFLVKYAAEQDLLPMELRLAIVALFGTALTVTGWYLKQRRPGYAQALQGGGVGVLYLTIFSAARLYQLVPLFTALGLMVFLVGVSTLLALLQNARSLAILGTIGGFLAPILTDNGAEQHLMLFSYYLLLNFGILSVSWFKSWRELNLVGFVFTFGISALWGGSSYQTKFLMTAELFLVAFFLIYFSISVLFSLRQPVHLNKYIDNTIVFGLPLVAFGLQSGLIGDTRFGLPVSAVVLAMLYITTAAFLRHMKQHAKSFLIEAFLALGVIFATLAVPLALSGYWTAGTWTLEGGGLYWVGIRQQRLTARISGLLLQAAAALSLLFAVATPHPTLFVGKGILAVTGLFISYLIGRHGRQLSNWEKGLEPVLLGWGLVWWLEAGFHQIDLMVSPLKNSQISLIFVTASIALFSRIAAKLKWIKMRHIGLGLLPLMLILALFAFQHRIKSDPFRHQWWIVWGVNFAVFYDLLKLNETFWKRWILKIYHMTGGLLSLFLVTWDAAYWVDFAVKSTETWPLTVWGVVPGLWALVLLIWAARVGWPVRAFPQTYQHRMVVLILIYLLFWSLGVCFNQADPAPLPYFPILNPIDLTILFTFLLMLQWNQKSGGNTLVDNWVMPVQLKVAVIGVLGHVWLSAVVIRTVHFWGQVPYNAPMLTTSALVQTSLSVLWSFYAMGVLFVSNSKGSREGWIAGAGLLAIVVIKLFLVDLSGSGTIARIVSFVAVGLLMLVIGYFSPLPPSIRRENLS